MSDRPERPGPTKRRPGEQLTRDDADDDDNEGPAHDPGAWRPVDTEAIKARRKVHVRRAGAAAAADTAAPAAAEAGGAPASEAPALSSSNPFAGISLAAPASAPSNPFAGISLVPPAAAATAPQTNGDKQAAESTQPAAAAMDTATEAQNGQPATETKPETAAAAGAAQAADHKEGGSAAAAAAGAVSSPDAAGPGGFSSAAPQSAANPFATLGGGAKPFGGGFGGLQGGFGALANTGASFAPAGGATAAAPFGTFKASGFNFGAGAFPAVAAKPLGSTGGAEEGGEGEDEGGEGEGGGEGMALFGNAVVQPVVSLPEQEKRTGEEEEESLFTADGALYEFDATANKWRERGRGEFKVNVSSSDGAGRTARMVMRQAANLRLLLNAKVYSGMPLQLMAANVGVTFGVVNAAGPAVPTENNKDIGSATPAASNALTAAASEALGSSVASTAKPTTWAVKIKSTDKVLSLHKLLNDLKSTPSAGAADDRV